jgi:hypothetical protein
MDSKKLLAGIIIVVIITQVAAVMGRWEDIKAGRPDFADLYGAGRVLYHGRSPAYPSRAVKAADELPGAKVDFPLQADTLHPPFEALIFVPLARLPYTAAFLVWFGCNLLMLCAVPIALWNKVQRLHGIFSIIALLFGTFFPVVVSLVQGQDSILLLLILTLAYVSMDRGREFRSGVLLGLGMFKFLIILPIVAALAASRNWRILAGFGSACLALILVSFALIGPGASLGYVPWILRYSGEGAMAPSTNAAVMPNLRGLLAAIVGDSIPSTWLTVVVAAVSLGVIVIVLRFATRFRDSTWSIRMSLLVTLGSLVSYHFYVHNAVILLLPLMLSTNEFASDKTGTCTQVIFAVIACAMYIVPKALTMSLSMPIFAAASSGLMILLLRALSQSSSAARRVCD